MRLKKPDRRQDVERVRRAERGFLTDNLRRLAAFFTKNMANSLTLLRIALAVAMVLTVPFSRAFWACYLCGGLSDMFDGMAARALKRQSAFGAKLDSVADMIFALAIAAVLIGNVPLPAWLWGCAAGIACVRLVGYGIGFYKYRAWPSLHTYANKLTGALIFAFPLLYRALGLTAAGIVLSAVALASSVEELLITLKSKQLDRACKGLFVR